MVPGAQGAQGGEEIRDSEALVKNTLLANAEYFLFFSSEIRRRSPKANHKNTM